MRAVVLSNDRIIESLNEKFVNTWVLNTDMKRLREAKGIDGMQPLARTIISGWKRHSPVDCLVISPDLELMGRQPVNELFNAINNMEEAYRRFLVESLEGKRPGLGSTRHVALNVLDVQRTSAENIMNAFVEAFKNLDSEKMLPMLTEDAREAFGMNTENLPEDVRTQMRQMLSQMEVLSSEYVDDEFHFRLRLPQSPEKSFKMRKVEGVWFIYDVK